LAAENSARTALAIRLIAPSISANASALPLVGRYIKVDVDRQAWEIADEHVDGRSAFEREAGLSGHDR